MSKDIFDTSLLDTMPSAIADDPQVIAMCKSLDIEFFEFVQCIEEAIILPNINKIENEDLLNLLAVQFHVDFWQDVLTGGLPSIEKKRELILKSLEWHTYKGTPWVVKDVLNTVFPRASVLEWFEYGGRPYFFKIVVGSSAAQPEVLNRVLEAVYAVKNARSWLEEFIVARPADLVLWYGAGTVQNITTQIFMMLQPLETLDTIFVGVALAQYKLVSIPAPEYG